MNPLKKKPQHKPPFLRRFQFLHVRRSHALAKQFLAPPRRRQNHPCSIDGRTCVDVERVAPAKRHCSLSLSVSQLRRRVAQSASRIERVRLAPANAHTKRVRLRVCISCVPLKQFRETPGARARRR